LKKALAVVLVILAGVIAFGILHDTNGQEEVKPQLVSGASSTVSAPARYTVQADDTCRGIAALYTGSEESWQQLFAANGDMISQEAARRGVAAEECPLQAGWVLVVPASWIPGGVIIETQEVRVNDDWSHWKSTVAFGVIGGILSGIAIGLAAPPLIRWHFRRRWRAAQAKPLA